jgi:hypothetical protein
MVLLPDYQITTGTAVLLIVVYIEVTFYYFNSSIFIEVYIISNREGRGSEGSSLSLGSYIYYKYNILILFELDDLDLGLRTFSSAELSSF